MSTRSARLALALVLSLGGASAAVPAAAETRTRLVECAQGSCLLVSGRREHATAPVSINGHEVTVAGGRKWQARVPMDTLRNWAAPYARTITVSVAGQEVKARLPIGLLGQPRDLAYLTISVK